MAIQAARLELKFIAEKMRNRFTVPDRLEGTAWSPKVMDLPPGERFLVLSPHPDDDAVGCGGTIIKLLDAGKAVRVVYFSMQEGNFTPEDRRKEIDAALAHLRVKDVRRRESAVFPSPKEAAATIDEEISAFKPDAVFMPSPFENHNEHIRTFESFLRAVEGRGDGPDAIMYEVWGALMPNLLVPVTGVWERKSTAIRDHGTQVREIDYTRSSQGLNGYRAASMAIDGYAEAFLYLPSSSLLRTFYR
ncbi:MAG: PIG-L deacetylase family protein [Methanomassiliicoccus sp.]|nr:PIG-L deacetylase family protein [Methanomassiliicoccus sp.]